VGGTAGYCVPGGHYAIAIALIVSGACVVSGVSWPTAHSALTGRLLYYIAAVGCGAHVTNSGEPFAPVRVRRVPKVC
jgi:3'-phosphoadenosine 5'-phosphosulfate (PAPS) 3'-phosphatase